MTFTRICSSFLTPVLFLGLVSSCDSKELSSASSDSTTNVTFNNASVTLSGSLYLPAGAGPHPAIVTVHGSGRQTRGSHKSIADYFVMRGIAVLSYDKRGVGHSEGTYTGIGPQNSETAFGDLSGDALAGVAFLTDHQSINAEQIGLLGVSQAGWIIPLAAAKSRDVAFIVLFSGPTVTVGEEIYYSDLTGDDGYNGARQILNPSFDKRPALRAFLLG